MEPCYSDLAYTRSAYYAGVRSGRLATAFDDFRSFVLVSIRTLLVHCEAPAAYKQPGCGLHRFSAPEFPSAPFDGVAQWLGRRSPGGRLS